ncbi:MAG: addiction module protein [Limisphaerales bacterium]
MTTLAEIEREAMNLTDAERAALAERLIASLPAVLSDDDDGVSEALRRDEELDRDPAASLTLDQLRAAIRA